MIPGLLITDGYKKGLYLRFQEGKPFWVGRAEGVDFLIPNETTISGRHCWFLRFGSNLEMGDESRNGTRLNGRKICHTKTALKNADILRIGKTHFQVVDLEKNHSPLELPFQSFLEDIQKRKESPEKEEILDGIGPYLNIEVIGSGAFGTVYKSVHESQKKLVALKVSMEDLSPVLAQRFLREADLLSKMEHPSIIKIYDKGIFEIQGENRIYIALEYFQAVNLYDHLTTYGPMPWQKLFKIFFQLLDALEYMHSQKIVHRDLKPDNVLYSDVSETAKVIDLGLGKSLQPEDRKTFFTTKPNSTLGTPHFMPIEQWGNVKSADERSDIYGLGATLYFLLTGKTPFGQCKDIERVYDLLIQKKLIPIEEYCPKEVPTRFLQLIKKMMAFHPEERYPNIKAVLQEFARVVASVS